MKFERFMQKRMKYKWRINRLIGVETKSVNLPIDHYLSQLVGILPVLRELRRGETITQTAKRLGMSQPALSRTISRWESELSVRLVERRGRGIELTAEGAALADAAIEALSVFQPALENLLGDRNLRPVRLGTLRSIAGELGPLIGRSSLPTNVSITEGSSDDLLRLIERGEIDAAIIGPKPTDTRFTWQFIRDQEIVLVVPKDHRLSHHDAVELKEVEGEHFVAMTNKYTTRDLADQLCAEAGISPTISVESDSSYTLRTYVASGLGLCILPEIMADLDPHIATVQVRRPNGELATREIGLVKMAGRPLPTQVNATLRMLLARPIKAFRRPPSQ